MGNDYEMSELSQGYATQAIYLTSVFLAKCCNVGILSCEGRMLHIYWG